MSAPTERLDWDVVCFGSVDWDSHDQRPQAVMRALERRGATITYVDNLGMRLPRLRDLARATRRVRNWRSNQRSNEPRHDDAIVRYSPVVVPLHHLKAVEAITVRVLQRSLTQDPTRMRTLVVWTYLPIPVISKLADRIGADVRVYDWADDFSEHVLTPSDRQRGRIAGWEQEMTAACDVVFVASKELLRRRGTQNDRTSVVPHGIDSAVAARLAVADDVAHLPAPRIGFVGSISEWIDLDLIDALAEARPSWSFLLIGPSHIRPGRLPQRPNIHHVGRRDHGDIPRYLESFDAAMLPYRSAPAVSAASPVKLREYLAHGLPVVSIDIPEVRPFAPPVLLASGQDGFLDALERGLARGRRFDGAPPRMWDDVVDEMVVQVQKALLSRSG